MGAERAGLLDDDKRALRLALDNNFVTSSTSLVVTTGQNGTTLASLGDEIVQDFPSRRNYFNSFSAFTPLNSPIPSGGRYNGGGFRGRSRSISRGSGISSRRSS